MIAAIGDRLGAMRLAVHAAAIAMALSVGGVPGVAQVEEVATPAVLELGQCIQRSWLHSMEEDTEEIIVYRPADYPFPPARGRIGYEFLPGGYLVYHGIGPADEPTLSHGRWEQPARNRITIRIDEPGLPIIADTWRVVLCSADRLEVER